MDLHRILWKLSRITHEYPRKRPHVLCSVIQLNDSHTDYENAISDVLKQQHKETQERLHAATSRHAVGWHQHTSQHPTSALNAVQHTVAIKSSGN
jgi:hypothetical protein